MRFRTQTDTEVLLRLYERHGLAALNMLNGMFAFALWDGRARKLLLVRDHAGIKPLYYWTNEARLIFASEIKALIASPAVPRRLNMAALSGYLGFLWVPGEETMLDGIKKLEPGHFLEWQDGKISVRKWFDLAYQPEEDVGEKVWVEEVRATFDAAVKRHMVSDVPLGAFLSGGLDSSSILASMKLAHPGREINAYTAVFPSGQIGVEQGEDDFLCLSGGGKNGGESPADSD